jgi:hypothetical protein
MKLLLISKNIGGHGKLELCEVPIWLTCRRIGTMITEESHTGKQQALCPWLSVFEPSVPRSQPDLTSAGSRV